MKLGEKQNKIAMQKEKRTSKREREKGRKEVRKGSEVFLRDSRRRRRRRATKRVLNNQRTARPMPCPKQHLLLDVVFCNRALSQSCVFFPYGRPSFKKKETQQKKRFGGESYLREYVAAAD